MADIRIDHGVVVTMDPARRVVDDGSVVITGDRIAAVGPTAEIAAAHPAGRVVDARRKAVIPGLIDAHAHAGHGLIKTMGGGDSAAWFDACRIVYTVASDAAFWRAEAALAGLERLKAGVTCGVSLLGGGDTVMRTDSPDYAGAHLDAIRELGIRVQLAVGHCRPPFPWTYKRWHGAEGDAFAVTFEDQLGACREIVRRWHGREGRRLNICLISPTLRREHVEDAGAAAMEEMVTHTQATSRLAREHGLVYTQDGHKEGTVQFAFDRLGILGPEALLSHSTDFTDDEIKICADTGTKIAHNPSAVASILGRCRAVEMIDAGVCVALGSDGTAPDRSNDMFRHMFQCMHYHRRHFRDPGVLPPGKVLEMCTIDAATALGMADDIGSLEAGKKADVVLVDLAKPHLYPFNMPLYRLACFANGADVDTVICDGRVLMEGRRVHTVDEAKVLDDAQAATETMLDRTGFHHLLDTPPTFFGHTYY
ncbi:MAG: amidohydrolase family protein [Deinococcus-Thermus bacterium]|jgi:cytosine/adenosine deaminase-related metal-dependent hydrolase|nr:amidohydrolase family protein [Deinococcota bacterium]